MQTEVTNAEQRRSKRAKWLAFALIAFGLLLHAFVGLFKSEAGPNTFSLGLMVWSWLPYLVGLTLLIWLRNSIIPLAGIIGPLILDLVNYYSVFIAPGSSTAALGLLWMPLWNLVIVEPVGLLIGWLLSKTKIFGVT